MLPPDASLFVHSPAPCAVLDTNVVLDWMVFDEPACRPLIAAVMQRRLRWVVVASMRRELERVLDSGKVAAWVPDRERIAIAWDRWAEFATTPTCRDAAVRLRCTDADDQPFIDLALDHPCRWLVSRDRAVLKLNRRARAFGLKILTPQAWTLDAARDLTAPPADSPLP